MDQNCEKLCYFSQKADDHNRKNAEFMIVYSRYVKMRVAQILCFLPVFISLCICIRMYFLNNFLMIAILMSASLVVCMPPSFVLALKLKPLWQKVTPLTKEV